VPAEPPPEEELSLDSLFALSPEEPAELSLELEVPVPVVPVPVVPVVEVVCAAAFSAVVSVGGVISGVVFGTASDTLVPPHAPSATAQASAAPVASRARARRP